MQDYIKLVADVIQNGYHDATQTELDIVVAEKIVSALRDAGWIDLETFGALVASAGGKINLQDKYLVNPPTKVWVEEKLHLGYVKVSVDCE